MMLRDVTKKSKERKDEVKIVCFDVLCGHYFRTAKPNTNAKYEDEGEDIYRKRIKRPKRFTPWYIC